MFTKNELSATTNRSVPWDCMIDQLTETIKPEAAKIYVQLLMLQVPHHANITGSTIHLANKPQ